jgi:hypothetical protein
VLCAVLALRCVYPLLDSPLWHLYSDPRRHWENGLHFLHPGIIGAGDPFLYQLWLFLLQRLAGDSAIVVQMACGLLCAAMPWGWYRALRELMPRMHALAGSVAVGLWPAFLGPYAYFMTETLLLTLTGFAFWLSLRALRKGTPAAFAAASVLWSAALFTRIVVLPMAALCLACAWLRQPNKGRAALIALAPAVLLALPAGLHARMALGYFAPLGNLYLNEIYLAGGTRNIELDFGPQGTDHFGSPSYYNPTFYPFSDWTTARQGTLIVHIDPQRGRVDWRRALATVRAARGATLHDYLENLAYLFFGQEWPDDDSETLMGRVEVWLRWLALPLVAWTATACVRRVYRGRQWLVPACALLVMGLLAVQHEGIMEGRYRKPVEPLLLASIVLALSAQRRGERLR